MSESNERPPSDVVEGAQAALRRAVAELRLAESLIRQAPDGTAVDASWLAAIVGQEISDTELLVEQVGLLGEAAEDA